MAAGNPAPQWHTPEKSWQQPNTANRQEPNLSMTAAESQASAGASKRAHQWQSPTPESHASLSLSQRALQESTQTLHQIPPQQASNSSLSAAPTPSSPFQSPISSPENTAEPVNGEAAPELDRLVNRMVFAVLDKLNDDSFVEKFTKSRELLNDNRQLANQIQQQLRQQKQHSEELNYYQTELTKFKKLFGSFYFKID